ncbi:MAG: DUF4252 domain-containing protein [Bacteroidota bacterium]
MKTKNLLMILFLFSVSFAIAQEADYTKEPGYFDYGKITNLKTGEMITEVYLEEPLIKMVAKMAEGEKDGIAEAIGALKLIRVNEFMVDNIESIEKALLNIDKELQSSKWSRIIKTKHKDNLANVYVKSGGTNEYVGLMITSLDKEGKVTLVNIVGNVSLDSIGKISKEFDLPGMDKDKE